MLQNTETRELMENVLDVYQLQIGLEDDCLEHLEECTYTDSCWIKELITAMARFKVKIYRRNRIEFKPHRKNDVTIMNLVKTHCTDTECRHINTCRQYLRALYISDILHPCGTKIAENYHRQTQFVSSMVWPTIPNPPQKT